MSLSRELGMIFYDQLRLPVWCLLATFFHGVEGHSPFGVVDKDMSINPFRRITVAHNECLKGLYTPEASLAPFITVGLLKIIHQYKRAVA